jgi:hypothetical protein
MPVTQSNHFQRRYQPRPQRQRHSQVDAALPKPASHYAVSICSIAGCAQTARHPTRLRSRTRQRATSRTGTGAALATSRHGRLNHRALSTCLWPICSSPLKVCSGTISGMNSSSDLDQMTGNSCASFSSLPRAGCPYLVASR